MNFYAFLFPNPIATAFLLFIALLGIVTIVFFIMSIVAQRSYDNDTLPDLPDLSRPTNSDDLISNLDDDDSMFVLDSHDDDSLDEETLTDAEAAFILKAAQVTADQKNEENKKGGFSKLFGGRKKK